MGAHRGRKKRVKQSNPKLKRPAAYFHTGKGEPDNAVATSSDGVPGMNDQGTVPFPPASTSNDQFLDGVLGLLKSQVDLDALEKEDEQGVGESKASSLEDMPLKRFNTKPLQSEKAAVEDFEQFVVTSFAKNKATRTELRKIMLTTRRNYENDLGGRDNLVQGERDYIATIVFLCMLEHLISMASMRRGVIKESRASGRVHSQPILEKLMGSVLNQKRLYIASLYSLHKLVQNGMGSGRRPAGSLPLSSAGHPYMVDSEENDGTVEGDMAVVNELNMILGRPVQTAEETVAEFKTLYEWPPPTDGSLPVPLRRG